MVQIFLQKLPSMAVWFPILSQQACSNLSCDSTVVRLVGCACKSVGDGPDRLPWAGAAGNGGGDSALP